MCAMAFFQVWESTYFLTFNSEIRTVFHLFPIPPASTCQELQFSFSYQRPPSTAFLDLFSKDFVDEKKKRILWPMMTELFKLAFAIP